MRSGLSALPRSCAIGPTLRCPHRAIAALRAAGVAVMERAATVRLARNPVALAYVVVFIYSSLRALPVAFVPGFRGQW